MTVLSDKWIKKMSKENGMISPFVDKQQKKNVMGGVPAGSRLFPINKVNLASRLQGGTTRAKS